MIKPEREKHRFTRQERSRSSDACLYWKKKLLTSSRIEEKTEIQNGGYERHGNFFLLLPKLYTFDVKWEIVSIAHNFPESIRFSALGTLFRNVCLKWQKSHFNSTKPKF